MYIPSTGLSFNFNGQSVDMGSSLAFFGGNMLARNAVRRVLGVYRGKL